MYYCSRHLSKAKASGIPAVTILLVLFCDDTSGNRSKKWNKFIECNMVCIIQASLCTITIIGLPQEEKNKLENIHLLCCSNKLDALTMAKDLVELLKRRKWCAHV